MSAEDLKANVRRLYAEVNKGKAAAIAVIDELYATDFVYHSSTGRGMRGIKDYKQHISDMYNAFPDFHFTIDDIVVEGEKVATRLTITGTHTGAFTGIPPTNKKVTLWEIEIDRVAGGKFVEGWSRYDTMGLMQQLGVIPTPKTEP